MIMMRFAILSMLVCAVGGFKSQLHAKGSKRYLKTCYAAPSPAEEETPKKKCFDFKDPSVYTYQDGKKKLIFKINEERGIVDSFPPQGRYRRSVSLPGGSDEDIDGPWGDFVELFNENAPVEWNLARMARNAKQTRLLRDRSYARPEPFEAINIPNPPGLEDLSPPKPQDGEAFWITSTARLLSFFVPYALFPYITRILDGFVTMPPQQLDEITSKFGPGISILYGTFISLTLSILYRRQQEIQSDAAIESSMLVLMTRNLLSLFRRDPALSEETGQCAADQIRTLVKGSRGGELILLMYSDPYARMLELVDCHEEKLIAEGKTDLGGKGVSIMYVVPCAPNKCLTTSCCIPLVIDWQLP